MGRRRPMTGQSRAGSGVRARALLPAFEAMVIVPTIVALIYSAIRNPNEFPAILLLWALIVALVELLPVPSSPDLELNTGFPLLMAVGFLYASSADAGNAILEPWDIGGCRS